MSEKRKPQGFSLGNPLIDDESITPNVTAINLLSAKSKYVFGKSAPIVTDYDILECELLPDVRYCNSMDTANDHLQALGFAPCWSREDLIRYHLHNMKREQLRRYVGAK
jgi:hypothetical protein